MDNIKLNTDKKCKKEGENFQRLVDIVARLRMECPWDREQTNQSIKRNLVEEAYELLEAIDKDDNEAMIEELGDLLLQVVFHSQIKKDSGKFDINKVIYSLIDKLIRRHPHVFGEIKYDELDGDTHLKKWENLKKKEKKRNSVLDGIPSRMPALQRAYKIQKKMATVGFDWNTPEEAIQKLEEELKEFKSAKNEKEKFEELGDILQAVVNVARFYNIDPEDALHHSLDKSERRFRYIEEKSKELNRDLKEMSLEEMENFWNEAKKLNI